MGMRNLAVVAALIPLALSGAVGKAVRDFSADIDLASAAGLEFDFRTDGAENVYKYVVHVKSGKGWYASAFEPSAEGRPCHVRVFKRQMRSEGVCDGWKRLKTVRVSAFGGSEGRTSLFVSNVRPFFVVPDVMVVYADSAAREGGRESGEYLKHAGTIADALSLSGVEPLVVADTELAANALDGVRAVVLPYNPSIPAAAAEQLRSFVMRGGRLLVCGALPPSVGKILGVSVSGSLNPQCGDLFGFCKVGRGLPGQPKFASQHSWNAKRILPGDGVEVVAEWGAEGKPGGSAAIVRTKAGLFVGHVWLGGAGIACADLLRTIVRDLDPSLGGKLSAARTREVSESRRLSGTLSARDEFRGLWCLTEKAFLGDDWDATARFVADNGCNALFCRFGAVGSPADETSFRECLRACRRHGLQCHVWTLCYCTNVRRLPKDMRDRLHAERRFLVGLDGKETRWLCPSSRENRRLIIDSLAANAFLGADGIHLDYIRYPDRGGCFCERCRRDFESETGRPVEDWPKDVRTGGLRNREWQDRRVALITETVREASRRIRRECPGVKISAAVLPYADGVRESQAQDWKTWCSEGLLDFVCPMDYSDSGRTFGKFLDWQRDADGKARVYPGIGLTTWSGFRRPAPQLADAISAVRKAGYGGFVIYGLGSRAEVVLPKLK